jgi:hypothetical protein
MTTLGKPVSSDIWNFIYDSVWSSASELTIDSMEISKYNSISTSVYNLTSNQIDDSTLWIISLTH